MVFLTNFYLSETLIDKDISGWANGNDLKKNEITSDSDSQISESPNDTETLHDNVDDEIEDADEIEDE